MKVLVLTHRLPYAPNRGDRIRAFHLIRALSRVADVHLVALAHDDEEWSHRGDLAEMTASTDVVRVRRAARLLPAALALPGSQPLTHLLLHTPEIYSVLRRRLAATPPDVVLAYCSGMARYACEPILSPWPFVLDLLDVDSEKWRALAAESSGPKRWVLDREARVLLEFERHAIERAVATAVVSERERELLERLTGLSALVVPNGIDLSWFTPQRPPAAEPRVVFCGVFSYEPNERAAIWFARDVWPAVVRARPDARLSLVGMEPTSAVRALASETIEVTGTVPDVREYLWRSAVAVAPLAIARGIQNKVLEALAAGLPAVITSAVAAGLPEDVRDVCSVADSPDDYAGAVLQLLSAAPDERRRLAGKADLASLGWDSQLEPLVRAVCDTAVRRRG